MRANLLEGVRVVELGSAWAGPFGARLLADLGADVIKVEAPRRPDLVRFSVYLDEDPGEIPWERGAHYQKFSRNKRGCVIDIGTERGFDVFTRLLDESDILIENNTPRVRKQFGLTDEFFAERLPHLVVISMPGFGNSGPYRDYLAYGITIEGFAGLSSETGYADEGRPARSTIPYGDPVAASYGTLSALAGLRARRQGEAGSVVELSQQETLASLLPDLFLRAQLDGSDPAPAGNDDPWIFAPHGTFRTRGGGPGDYVALAVETDAQWNALCELVGRPDLQPLNSHEERDGASVRQAIEAWTSERERDRVVDTLQEAGIPVGPVLSPKEMSEQEQVVARGVYEPVEHPLYRTIPYARAPFLFPGQETRGDLHAPLFGEHNREVFGGLLGMGDAEINELYELGVTADRPDMA